MCILQIILYTLQNANSICLVCVAVLNVLCAWQWNDLKNIDIQLDEKTTHTPSWVLSSQIHISREGKKKHKENR